MTRIFQTALPTAFPTAAHRAALPMLPVLLALSLAAQAADTAPARTAPAAGAGGLFQVLFGLIVVLGLLAGAAWLMKRLGAMKPAGSAAARVVGGVNVGTRERVIVVEVADQWIVVGVAPGSVNALHTMPRQALETPPADAAAPNGPAFATWLKNTIEKRNGK